MDGKNNLFNSAGITGYPHTKEWYPSLISYAKINKIDWSTIFRAKLCNSQMVKNLPAMWETCVRSLGWEDPWRRARHPTPVFLPGEFHGQRSFLAGYSPWGCKEVDKTEWLSTVHEILRKNVHVNLYDLGLGTSFLSMIAKVQTTIENLN